MIRDLRVLLQDVLREAGYHVQCLPDGSAIVKNEFELPDLFILDKEMNFIDGIAISKYLRLNKRTKQIPILMITGYAELESKAMNAGVDYFMPKPINVHQLLEVANSLTCGVK